MDKLIDILVEDLRTIRADVAEIQKIIASNTETLKINTEDLKHHMSRSAANEQAVKELRDKITPVLIQFNILAKAIILLASSGILWKLIGAFASSINAQNP